MKNIIKIIILAVILILFVLLFIFINSFNISGFATEEKDYNFNHSWTKAICNETHCQDYEIYCKGNRLVEQIPITGAIIEIPENWIDPRNETMRERVCG